MLLRHLFENEFDYRGQHSAPDKESGAPIYNVTLNGIYPDDFYKNPRLYEDDPDYYAYCSMIVNSVHNKPNAKVKIYRAVPHTKSTAELITQYEKEKAYMLKNGKIPPTANTSIQNQSKYYDWVYDELERLKSLPEQENTKLPINPGDWVTIHRKYAMDHGNNSLNKKFKIISKSVPAKHIFTAGDSLAEWGYDPS